MNNELHIQLKPDISVSLDELLNDFPFAPGQSIRSVGNGMVIIDLGNEEDTNIDQEWYLNSSEDVLSFYIVED